MGAALPIRDGLTSEALCRQARHEANRRAALRMLAIADALEGMSRAEAARLAGMERQALRDAVVRAREALWQAIPPVQPVASAQAARPVAAEDPARPSRGRPGGPGAFRKKGCTTA